MTAALILLSALIAVGVVLRITHRPDSKSQLEMPAAAPDPHDGQCCGLHEVCTKYPSENPVYYDDEELDRYKGREADRYNAQEIDEFREVMLTLLASDAHGWSESLAQRGIALPDELTDELKMIIAESV